MSAYDLLRKCPTGVYPPNLAQSLRDRFNIQPQEWEELCRQGLAVNRVGVYHLKKKST